MQDAIPSSNKNQGLHQFADETFDVQSWRKEVAWRTTDVTLRNKTGDVIFHKAGVEVPAEWSDMAAQIVGEKYLVKAGPLAESSVATRIHRIMSTIAAKGIRLGYFTTTEKAQAYYKRMCLAMANQQFAFNSPVWFNVGVKENPQCSACFIHSVEDNIKSITDYQTAETMLFKQGSGSGASLSKLRGSNETLSLGGKASGPVSFMRGFDATAGVIKSGGTTRRAAKMVTLDDDHPDIEEFIECKAIAEKAAHALCDAGFDHSFDAAYGAYGLVPYQNANHSVRISDEFMQAVNSDGRWFLRNRTDGQVCKEVDARVMWRSVARAAWVCADPAVQFDGTINRWHTCKASGKQNSSNPCSEFVFLDDTACNLSSINLIKFLRQGFGGLYAFDVYGFINLVDDLILAMDIIVDLSSYPTDKITQGSAKYRTLGLGYTNLGGVLLSLGLPYDSDEGRAVCAAITSLMGGRAYVKSGHLASLMGAFPEFEKNRSSFHEVMIMHLDAQLTAQQRASSVKTKIPLNISDIHDAASEQWSMAVTLVANKGMRNAQVTVLAPTGTISFAMDSATTGIEPEFGLVKYKKLVGGGFMTIVNPLVKDALSSLGYDVITSELIEQWIVAGKPPKTCPSLKPEHHSVFDCANQISPMGHLHMMAAAQPFLSGAISKTVNMDYRSTIDEILEVYQKTYELGLKCVAIYRNNCKRSQPLSEQESDEKLGGDTPPCHYCNSHRTYRRGRCVSCENCGESSSCS